MVVGEIAVHFAEQLDHLAADGAEDGGCRRACDAVAAIHHHLHAPRQLDVGHDACRIGSQHVELAYRTASLQDPVFGLHHAAQRLDVFAVNGTPDHHHLETVVVPGVVAARYLDATGASRGGRVIQHGRGDHSHINDLDAGSDQATHQRSAQGWAAQSPVTANRHRAFALGQGNGPKGLADAFGGLFGNGGRHNAPDVVGLEDGSGYLHVDRLCRWWRLMLFERPEEFHAAAMPRFRPGPGIAGNGTRPGIFRLRCARKNLAPYRCA